MKLIDFGLSRRFEEGEVLKTPVGTAFYVAPEVLGRSYSNACDLWSCGVILYCLLCGSPPFRGNTDQEIMANVRRARYSFDGKAWEPVSNEAKAVISNLLHLDPKQRFTAQEALADKWFAQDIAVNGSEKLLHPELADNLRAFSLTTRFKKVALTAIAHNLSEAEREKLRASFIAMDKDSNGFLTLNEFKEGLAVLGSSVPADLAEIMEHVDTNHDGGVEYTEFLAAAMDERLHRDEECCWKAFKAFDNDNDGFITKEELRGLIEGCLGDQLRDQ
ncbi:unnamed protein product, partial [Polarella glacialis]